MFGSGSWFFDGYGGVCLGFESGDYEVWSNVVLRREIDGVGDVRGNVLAAVWLNNDDGGAVVG